MKPLSPLCLFAAAVLCLAGCGGEDRAAAPSAAFGPQDLSADKARCPEVEVVFQSPGGVQDFTILQSGFDYHIFHIADAELGWPSGGAKNFGHATSMNLQDWTYHPRIELRHADWSKDCVWAPHIIEEDGVYYMFYTGVEWDPAQGTAYNWQRIGLATSTDLMTWTPHGTNGLILDGAWHDEFPWSAYGTPGEWKNDCRDPFVFKDGDEYVMFVSIRLWFLEGAWTPMAIGIAKSPNLIDWTWSHYLYETRGGKAESPNLVELNGTYYLMWTTTNDGDIKVASATDIDGPYTLRTSDGLYGYANETLLTPRYRIYGAIVDDYDHNGWDLRLKKVKFHPTDPVATTWDFTTCDFWPIPVNPTEPPYLR